MDELKIIQIQAMPNDAYWQGGIIGLGNNGVTYLLNGNQWEVYAENITLEKEEIK